MEPRQQIISESLLYVLNVVSNDIVLVFGPGIPGVRQICTVCDRLGPYLFTARRILELVNDQRILPVPPPLHEVVTVAIRRTPWPSHP